MGQPVEIFDAVRSGLGESPLWRPGESALYWVDVFAGLIHRRDLRGNRRTWDFGEEVGSIGMRRRGGLVVAARSGFYGFIPETGEKEILALGVWGKGHRLNDGKVDRSGRFWSGSLSEPDYPPVGTLFCIDAHHRVTSHVDELRIPNALCWSPDGAHMYFADSLQGRIETASFNGVGGTMGRREPFAAVPDGKGFPDGATVDRDGNLWCANIYGSRILCYSANGTLVHVISLPVSKPTSCTFGGEKLDTLYVTTSSNGLEADHLAREPFAGAVLAIRIGEVGLPEPAYIEER